ncbi:MAG: sugar phosphate isomerase/epimerase [Tannerella sp.]|nr:sugar phosphate isomerase/epimerase [Tannerella sp.]
MFVKPLEKYGYDDIATLLSEAGFDGADISFRKNGLIVPETAGVELPKAIKALEKKNLSVPMVVSEITSPKEPETEDMIRIMVDNGVKYYRLGAINYDKKQSIRKHLDILKTRMSELCELNARHNIHGAIQNHAGMGLGAPVWDACYVVQDCDPKYLGIQYDVRHAVAEGMGSWPLALEMALDYIHTTCIKDFAWIPNEKKFRPLTVPLGEGIVDFDKYFEILKMRNITAPVSIHYEYSLLNESQANYSIAEQMKCIIPKLKHDLVTYKEMSNKKV